MLAEVTQAGQSLAVPATAFRGLLDASVDLNELLLRYTQSYMTQICSSAVASSTGHMERRVARWLLMAADRLDSAEVPVTHDMIARALGVRRPGVTVATHRLEGERVIRASRGKVVITDRGRLRQLAGHSYGLAESEYNKTIGSVQHLHHPQH